jgi:hypothetical protein
MKPTGSLGLEKLRHGLGVGTGPVRVTLFKACWARLLCYAEIWRSNSAWPIGALVELV